MRGVTESWRLSETLELLNTVDPMRIAYQLSGESGKVIVITSAVFLRIEKVYIEAKSHQRDSESNGEKEKVKMRSRG